MSDLDISYRDMLERASTLQRRLDRDVGALERLAHRGKQLTAEIGELNWEIGTLERASILLHSVGEETQQLVQRQLEALVNQGLAHIYAETPMTFSITTDVKRKQMAASFAITSQINGTEVTAPVLDVRGGGVVAAVSFILRVVVDVLSGRRPTYILDETFAHVSPDFEPRVAEFLQTLCTQLGIQVVLITHSSTYAEYADTAYRFDQHDGETFIS